MTWNIYLGRNGCRIPISTVHLSMLVSSLNQHIKKITRLGKIASQINFLLCVCMSDAGSCFNSSLLQRLCCHSICFRIILAIRKPIDNIKADSKTSYKCSNQIGDLTLKPFCVCDFMVGRLSLTIWYHMTVISPPCNITHHIASLSQCWQLHWGGFWSTIRKMAVASLLQTLQRLCEPGSLKPLQNKNFFRTSPYVVFNFPGICLLLH